MNINISENTKAILLLNAPLLLGTKNSITYDLLKPQEYQQLASYLIKIKKQPSDLLSEQVDEILDGYAALNKSRIKQLLNRGFLLSQAIENWNSRGIWVISRADKNYPQRLKEHLKEQSPAILYGCGDVNLLNCGGLAVVGSRNINDELMAYTQKIAHLSAQSQKMVISGGAKGVDSTAMYGSLAANGWACGVLAGELEKEALNPVNRLALQNKKLVIISTCDPKARFNAGNAMQRNKYIYALADAALIVNSDLNKGGTWNGAKEQLEKYRQIPIYIRSTGSHSDGLNDLKNKGALLWSNPDTPQKFLEIFNVDYSSSHTTEQLQLSFSDESANKNEFGTVHKSMDEPTQEQISSNDSNPKNLLFSYVSGLIRELTLDSSKKDTELADELGVSPQQMNIWLERLLDEQLMIKADRPVKYRWKQ